MSAAARPRVLADIGGTNARFAWQAAPGEPIENVQTLACAEHDTVSHALGAYLARLGGRKPAACAMAIANPVLGDQVTMTNHHWSFSIAALKAELGLRQLLVINDFTALALAVPLLEPGHRWQLGGGAPTPGAAIGLIGPGTGLGVSGLLPNGHGGWLPIQGEGGHATLAATTPREAAVLEQLGKRHGHVSAERAICGQGLVDLHRAVCALDAPAAPPPTKTAAEITSAALEGRDSACAEALDLFCAFLGIAAGNLALTLGAKGGIYIGGGIVPRLGAWFAQSPFRARFEAKGRFASYLADVPVFVINTPESPAFLGVAYALDADVPFAGRAG
jgi:glucokinase